MKKLGKIVAGAVSVLPALALAQYTANPTYLQSLIGGAKTLLDQLVIFLIALAVVWFIWNVIRFTMSTAEDAKEKAKSQMIYGIIAIAVIVSVWGLVAILQSLFGINTTGAGNVSRLLP